MKYLVFIIDAREETLKEKGRADFYFTVLNESSIKKYANDPLEFKPNFTQTHRCANCHEQTGVLDLDTLDGRYKSYTPGVPDGEIFDLVFRASVQKEERHGKAFEWKGSIPPPPIGGTKNLSPSRIDKCYSGSKELSLASKNRIASAMYCYQCHNGQGHKLPQITPPFGPALAPENPFHAAMSGGLMPPEDWEKLEDEEHDILQECLFAEYFSGIEPYKDKDPGPFHQCLLGKSCIGPLIKEHHISAPRDYHHFLPQNQKKPVTKIRTVESIFGARATMYCLRDIKQNLKLYEFCLIFCSKPFLSLFLNNIYLNLIDC